MLMWWIWLNIGCGTCRRTLHAFVVSVQLDGGDSDNEALHRLDMCREEGLDVEYRAL